MVAYVIDEQTKPKAGYVCPKCFRELMGPAVSGKQDQYGRTTRSYFGWCVNCDVGFEAIQFKQGDTKFGWLIHKYRFFKILEGSDKPQPVTAWLTMNELPEPALVVIGPGGDFNQHYDFNTETFKLLQALKKALDSTNKIINQLLMYSK